MQQKNFWLFLLLSAGILLGWTWLQTQLWPVVPKKPGEISTKKIPGPEVKKEPPAWPWQHLPAGEQSRIVAGLTAATSPALSGAGSLVDLAAAALLPDEVRRQTLRKQEQEKPKIVAQQPAPPAKIESVTLGNDDFFIQAVLSTQGAGVRKLTLTNFQAANWLGQPVYTEGPDGKRQPAPLDIINDDPILPSFLMYHYAHADPDPEKDRPEAALGVRNWTLEKRPNSADETQTAVFSAWAPPPYEYLKIRKTYTLNKGWYHVGLALEIEDTRNRGGKQDSKAFRYQLAGAHGTHLEGVRYTYTHRNAMIGMFDPNREHLTRDMEQATRLSYRQGGDKVPAGNRGSSRLQYAAVTTQYFASAIAVDNQQPAADVGGVPMSDILAYARPTVESAEKFCRLDKIMPEQNLAVVTFLEAGPRFPTRVHLLPRALEDLKEKDFKPGAEMIVNIYNTPDHKQVAAGFRQGTQPKPFLDDVTVRVVSEPVQLQPGEKRVHNFLLYHGPVKVRQLDLFAGQKSVKNELVTRYAETLHLETMTDHPSPGFFGWLSQTLMWTDLLIFFTKCMHWLLNVLYWIVPYEGLVIVLLTVMVRGAMFPISRRQAMMTARMQELQPEIKKIQEKYKNDPQARNQAVMEMYRKYGVNPLGGCLPLVIQLPIFLSLYYALQESIRFRLAPFLWIDNLSAPDMLIYWGQSMPWLTDPDNMGGVLYLGPFFNLLPVLAVAIMIVQQQLMMPPPTDEQQEMQQKMMKYMVVVFGIMFYKVAAGLVIYFIASSLWGLTERKLLPKKKVAPGTPAAVAETPAKNGPGPRGGPGGKKRGKSRGPKPPEESTQFKKVRDWWEEVLKQAKKK